LRVTMLSAKYPAETPSIKPGWLAQQEQYAMTPADEAELWKLLRRFVKLCVVAQKRGLFKEQA